MCDLWLSISSLWYCYIHLSTRCAYSSHLWQYLQGSLDTCFSSLLSVSNVISDNVLRWTAWQIWQMCVAQSSLRSERQYQTSSVCLCLAVKVQLVMLNHRSICPPARPLSILWAEWAGACVLLWAPVQCVTTWAHGVETTGSWARTWLYTHFLSAGVPVWRDYSLLQTMLIKQGQILCRNDACLQPCSTYYMLRI